MPNSVETAPWGRSLTGVCPWAEYVCRNNNPADLLRTAITWLVVQLRTWRNHRYQGAMRPFVFLTVSGFLHHKWYASNDVAACTEPLAEGQGCLSWIARDFPWINPLPLLPNLAGCPDSRLYTRKALLWWTGSAGILGRGKREVNKLFIGWGPALRLFVIGWGIWELPTVPGRSDDPNQGWRGNV